MNTFTASERLYRPGSVITIKSGEFRGLKGKVIKVYKGYKYLYYVEVLNENKSKAS